MQFNERVLKIIESLEGGSNSKFAAKLGVHVNQVYNMIKPNYTPRKTTVDRIKSAYPGISVEWLTSDIGDMTNAITSQQEGKTNKFDLSELPDQMTAHQVLSHIMKYTGNDSLVKLSVKLNLKPNDLNQVFNGEKPMGAKLAQVISKTFPEIPYQWIKTGENPSVKSPKKQDKVIQDRPLIQTPVIEPTPEKKVESKSSTPDIEIQMQTILQIHENLLSDYQKLIEINHRLNNVLIELSEKVLSLSQKNNGKSGL